MYSVKSFLKGTVYTFIQLVVGLLFLSLVGKYLLGADIYTFYEAFEFLRGSLAYNAQMVNNEKLIFLTSKAFWKSILTLGIIIIWWLNIRYQERKNYRQEWKQEWSQND